MDYEKLSGERLGESSESICTRVQAAMTQLNLSARTDHRILKLARTIADLCAKELDPTIWSVRFRNNFSFKVE